MSAGAHGKNEIGKYLAVGGGLLVLTVVTVAVSYLHIQLALAIIIALAVATFKSSLVAGFFMHLKEEKPVILILLGFTVFFFLCMIGLILAGQYSVFEGLKYVH